MVSQLLSAAAEAELRHLRDERRGQSPRSHLRAAAPAILRTSASGKASCSSGSAPICCCVSNTWDLQPSQQRARKQASFAVFSVQQPASTCPYRAATSKRRPPAKQLRGGAQQDRRHWGVSLQEFALMDPFMQWESAAEGTGGRCGVHLAQKHRRPMCPHWRSCRARYIWHENDVSWEFTR